MINLYCEIFYQQANLYLYRFCLTFTKRNTMHFIVSRFCHLIFINFIFWF